MSKLTSELVRLVIVITSFTCATSCGSVDSEQLGPSEVVALNAQVDINGDLTAGVPLRLESFNLARLEELKRRETLDTVLADGNSEFERILLLKEWVSAQWPQGSPNPYPPWDAIVILDWIRTGITGGFCAQYAQVLLQSLAAYGMTGRYVEIGSTGNPYAHFVMEVWSNEFDKWIVLDADYNLHFERDGIPLSALEVHDALVRSELNEVVVVPGVLRAGHSDRMIWPLQTAELYYYVRVHLKANHVSVPGEPPFDRFNDMVEWLDDLTVPWEFSQVASPYPKARLTNLQTNDRAAIESRLNQVFVTIESTALNTFDLRFDNNVHEFQTYELRELAFRSQRVAWRTHPTATFQWRPTSRTRILEVRGTNVAAVPGPVSRIVAR